MGDDRTDFDHAIPMTDSTAEQQEADLAGSDETGPSGDAASAGAASAGRADNAADGGSKVEDAKQTIRENAGKVGQQASDKARAFAEQGKDRASGALDQLSQMLTDAAGQVDDKIGQQYGQYARQAASSVQSLSDQIRGKELDELLDDARALVRKSPAVAVGAAAAVGFVVARLIQAGIDDQRGGAA